jgi:hypothetical protein
MPRGFALDDDSMRRVGDAVRAVEGWPSDERDQRRGRTVATQPTLQWIQCAGEVDDDGRYAAVWVEYLESTDTWTEMADCYLRPGPNAETPTEGQRYLSRCHGVHPDDGYPVYVPVVAGGAAALDGALVRMDADVAIASGGGGVGGSGVTFAYAEYDSGSYFNVVSPLRLTVPEDGWYLCGAQCAWEATGAGLRTFYVTNTSGYKVIKDDRVADAFDITPGVPGVFHQSGQAFQYLYASEYIRMFVGQSSGSTIDLKFNGDTSSSEGTNEHATEMWIQRLA